VSGRRGEAPSRTLRLLCVSVSLPAFHHSASGRFNKPLMRNGCYSASVAVLLRNYHLSHLPLRRFVPSRLSLFFLLRSCSVLSTTATSAFSYFRPTPIGRLYDVDDETTYPVRHASIFRPNAMPAKVADSLKCRKFNYGFLMNSISLWALKLTLPPRFI